MDIIKSILEAIRVEKLDGLPQDVDEESESEDSEPGSTDVSFTEQYEEDDQSPPPPVESEDEINPVLPGQEANER